LLSLRLAHDTRSPFVPRATRAQDTPVTLSLTSAVPAGRATKARYGLTGAEMIISMLGLLFVMKCPSPFRADGASVHYR